MQENAAAHSPAPTLRRYAAMSLLLWIMAFLRGVSPLENTRVKTCKINQKLQSIFNRACGRARTVCFLHSRQLWFRREIGKSPYDRFQKRNEARSTHCENKRVKTSEVIKKQRSHFHKRMYGGVLVIFCIHVSFGLQQKLTCLEVISKR